MNRDLVRDHTFNIADLDSILKRTVRPSYSPSISR